MDFAVRVSGRKDLDVCGGTGVGRSLLHGAVFVEAF